MGQYHLVVNLDKQEFLMPHRFGDGLKLLEFGCSPNGTLTGLAILLSCSNGRGGGDLSIEDYAYDADSGEFTATDRPGAELARTIVGRWTGDRIAIVGDYAEDGDLAPEFAAGSIYGRCFDCDGTVQRTAEGTVQYPASCGRTDDHAAHGPEFRDVSDDVIRTMAMDSYLQRQLQEQASHGFAGGPDAALLTPGGTDA